jgi:hypothetical protein
MDETKPTAPPRCPPCVSITGRFRIELETNGPVTPTAGAEVKDLLQPVEVPKPTGKFRPVEFSDEVVEETHDQIRELSALSPQRDEFAANNPPPPDEKAKRLADLEAGIRADMRALGFVRIEIHPADEDPFDLFTAEE